MTIPAPFSDSHIGIDITMEQVCQSLTELDHWSERYRQLFILADKNNVLDKPYRQEQYLVDGCENSVWLLHYHEPQQDKHYFVADSDSKIIRGLLVLILSGCNGQKADDIISIQLQPLLKQLDFGKYLTPSRTNGLLSVMDKIRSCILTNK